MRTTHLARALLRACVSSSGAATGDGGGAECRGLRACRVHGLPEQGRCWTSPAPGVRLNGGLVAAPRGAKVAALAVDDADVVVRGRIAAAHGHRLAVARQALLQPPAHLQLGACARANTVVCLL